MKIAVLVAGDLTAAFDTWRNWIICMEHKKKVELATYQVTIVTKNDAIYKNNCCQ